MTYHLISIFIHPIKPVQTVSCNGPTDIGKLFLKSLVESAPDLV